MSSLIEPSVINSARARARARVCVCVCVFIYIRNSLNGTQTLDSNFVITKYVKWLRKPSKVGRIVHRPIRPGSLPWVERKPSDYNQIPYEIKIHLSVVSMTVFIRHSSTTREIRVCLGRSGLFPYAICQSCGSRRDLCKSSCFFHRHE